MEQSKRLYNFKIDQIRMFKRISILIITVMVLQGCQKRQIPFYKTTQMYDGFPEILNPLKKDLPFKITSNCVLDSRNDSLDIYFGELKQNNMNGNWLGLASNHQIVSFKSINFDPNLKNERDNIFEIDFNNSLNKISLKIIEIDSLKNKVTYSWINQSVPSDSLIVQNIDNPLKKGKAFPKIELTDINGSQFNFDSIEEQTIVLNWWSVSCAPCIREIPSLNKLVEKYSEKDVKFISVTNDKPEKVSNFLKNIEFKYDIAFVFNKEGLIFGNSYPRHIVLDNMNTITLYEEGGNEVIGQKIDEHLKARH